MVPVPAGWGLRLFSCFVCPQKSSLLVWLPIRVETFFSSSDFGVPREGPGFPRKGPGGQFRPKNRPRAAFFARFLRQNRKFGENAEIVVFLKREHHFQGPRRTQSGPLGDPGAPKMMPGRARNRKRRKNHTLIYFCLPVLPLPPSFLRVLGFWESFWALPGAPGSFGGAPGDPKTCLESCPGPPSGTGVDSGSIWGRFGVDLGSILGRFGVTLGSVLPCSGLRHSPPASRKFGSNSVLWVAPR